MYYLKFMDLHSIPYWGKKRDDIWLEKFFDHTGTGKCFAVPLKNEHETINDSYTL